MLALLRELLPAMGRAQTKVRSKLNAKLKIWISLNRIFHLKIDSILEKERSGLEQF